MLDEAKINRLAEIFGWPKIAIRQLLTRDNNEIIITFDDVAAYLKTKIADKQHSNIDFTGCVGLIETAKQWKEIFPLLSKLAERHGCEELIVNILIPKWTASAEKEIKEASDIVDKINIYHQSPVRLQDKVRVTIKQQAKDFINESLSWRDLHLFISKMREHRSRLSEDLISEANQKLHEILEKAIPKISDELELWKIRNEVNLPHNIQEQVIRRLYEIME